MTPEEIARCFSLKQIQAALEIKEQEEKENAR